MLTTAKLCSPRPLTLATCAAATLALAGCGHSDKAGDAVTADNVEMPAEETMSGLAVSAMPQADPSASATDQPPSDQPAGADASISAANSAAEAASGPAPDAPVPSAPASPAAPIRM